MRWPASLPLSGPACSWCSWPVLFDLDLLAGDARYKSSKFMRVWNWFHATDLPMAWGWELAVLIKTPGFGLDHLRVAFRWLPTVMHDEIPQILDYFADPVWNVEAAARANFESITLEDGFDFLHAMLEMRPKYQASVPLCVSQALRQLRADGWSQGDIAKRFKVSKRAIGGFWLEERFDPFTGRSFIEKR